MPRPLETRLTISCLQCDWSVETTNTSAQLSAVFLEEVQAHADHTSSTHSRSCNA